MLFCQEMRKGTNCLGRNCPIGTHCPLYESCSTNCPAPILSYPMHCPQLRPFWYITYIADNLAYKKPTKTTAGKYTAGFQHSKAVDGDRTARLLSSKSCFMSALVPEAFWSVDLQAVYNVRIVLLVNNYDKCKYIHHWIRTYAAHWHQQGLLFAPSLREPCQAFNPWQRTRSLAHSMRRRQANAWRRAFNWTACSFGVKCVALGSWLNMFPFAVPSVSLIPNSFSPF
jgi:hypothetical protein